MSKHHISKYNHHLYTYIPLFLLSCSTVIYFLWSNFSPTVPVKIIALMIASLLYVLLLLYFLHLKKNQEWIIPRQWKNVQKKPRLYSLVVFPIFIISILWFNLAGVIPMIWTYATGNTKIIETSAIIEKKRTKNSTVYFFKTIYSNIPLFIITSKEYEVYKDHQLQLKLSTRQSAFGTYILSIDEIQIATESSANK